MKKLKENTKIVRILSTVRPGKSVARKPVSNLRNGNDSASANDCLANVRDLETLQ